MPSPAANVLHPGLAPAAGAPLATAAAGLRDRERLAVLLQGIGLLAILARAGWRLARGWRGAAVAEDLKLTGVEAEPGPARLLPQEALRELVVVLFGNDEVAGRGEARRVVRDVVEPWRQALAPIVPELAVASLLNATALLWEDWAGAARRGLVGRLVRGRSWQLWVAAPRAMRSHLLATAPTYDELICLLGGSRAREEWLCAVGALGGDGRPAPRRATLATRQDAPPVGLDERRAWAQELFVAGRFQAALAVALPDDLPTRVLHLRCHHDLGDLAAQRQVLRQLPAGPFDLETELQVAEIAVRLASKSGDAAGGRTWVARARQAAGLATEPLRATVEGEPLSPAAATAEILTANAAADQGRPAAMTVHLDAARSALGDPEVTWRWHAARALQAVRLGDGVTAVSHAEGALRAGRHGLPRSTTGRLWSDLAVARFVAGDLAGAERACAHAAHRLQACDGNLAVTLALPNLAEIRLRRGRLQGVEEILARTERENARLGNVLGAGHDRQLRVRYDLARGEATLALERARALLNDLPASGCRATVLRVFAARAAGWLSRPADAAADLAAGGADALEELEPEERPAVWVLAGRPDEAWREAERSRHGGLWRAVLRGERAAPELWDAVEELEPFRAARLVFDVELVSPALVPPRWLRRAIATLRRLGVERLASRLEAASIDPWTAVAGYLALPAGDRAALRNLFVAAGFGDVRLWWQGAEDAVVVVDGSGGGEELTAPLAGGGLHLRSTVVDPPLRALFQLARRELMPGGAGLLTATGEVAPSSPVPRGGSSFVGNSQPVLQALDRLARFARTDLPVLVLGETGTGKELAASEAHRLSRRAAAPFLAVNCAAFSETLIQSELFGHVRGAFTGADRDRAGLFETARGGTVFLDEIGDLPLAAQGNLLRLLQEGEVRRLGESVARRVDVRVVAATHRELVDMVAAGTFRGDLLYRLRGGTVRLPPLRERGDDVLLLAGRVLARAAAAGASRRLSPAARAALLSHSWPGNVRELQNVLEAAVALADLVIEPVHLELPPPTSAARATAVGDYHRQVEQFRKKLIADALAAAGGNMAAAARVLGVSRQTLSYAVRELGIDWPGPAGAGRKRQ
jgi:transcriptional regulator with AAA-type ATPase domain